MENLVVHTTNGPDLVKVSTDVAVKARDGTPYTWGELEEVVNEFILNEFTSSNPFPSRRASVRPDDRRDIDSECGYPASPISIQQYRVMYDRDPIAARVVELWPKETWQGELEIYDDEDPNTDTQFEQDLRAVVKRLRGERSFFAGKQGNPLYEKMEEADIKAGIGSYGGIVIGVDDGLDWENSAEFRRPDDTGKGDPNRLLYMRTYAQDELEILELEDDVTSPRYGQPTMYQVVTRLPDTRNQQAEQQVKEESQATKVHWTRVVHVSDGGVYGTPRMQQNYNTLYNLQKVYGADPETFWLAAYGGLSLETHPSLGGKVKVNVDELRSMLQERNRGLQKDIILRGMVAKLLNPTIADPTAHIEKQIEAICIRIGCPKRVFMGSERGELASSQDDVNWNDRGKHHQENHNLPHVVIPTVDRLILLGIISSPQGDGYQAEFGDLTSQSDEQRSNVAKTWTQCIQFYVQFGLHTLMSPMDFLTLVMRLTEKEAENVVANAEEYGQEKARQDAEKAREDAEKARAEAAIQTDIARGKIDAGVLPDPAAQPAKGPQVNGTAQ